MTPIEIRAARQQLGLTQTELAAWLGLQGDGRRVVRSWEDGDRPITGPARVAIGAFLAGYRP